MAEGAIDDTPKSGITGEPEPLSEKALREASPAIEVFGEALVKKTTKYTHRLLWSVFSWFYMRYVNKDLLIEFLHVQSCYLKIWD